jgi:hypothetical protein
MVAGLAVYAMWRRASVPPMPEAVAPLVKEIAELDARFDRGDVDASAYEQQRQALERSVERKLRR